MNNLAFLFYCFLLLPVGSFAQHKIPVLEQCTITQLKANSQIIIPVKKQVIPFREKIFVRFEELGEIYNPTFPETRHKISVYNFQQQGAGFLYLSIGCANEAKKFPNFLQEKSSCSGLVYT